MITPRYHLVTIVAIFLALGLGLLAGSSFGQPTLVGQLRERTEAQLRRIEELRAEVDDERARAEAVAAYVEAATPHLIAGRLDGWRAVVVTQEGVPSALEASVLAALDAAGARVLGTFAAEPSLGGSDASDAATLATILGPPEADGGTASATRAGDRVAERFAAAIAPVDPEVDVLAELLAAGFLAARDGSLPEETRMEIARPLLVVVLGGSEPDAEPLATRSFAAALVAGLADAGVTVAAVEPTDAGDRWVEDLATGRVVTVVGADAPPGAAALILGLAEALRTGEGGAFGGDRAPLPPPP